IYLKFTEKRNRKRRNSLLAFVDKVTQKAEDTSILNRTGNGNEELFLEFLNYFKQLNCQSSKPETGSVEEKPQKYFKFINNRLYHFVKIENTDAYERFPTPTTIDASADNLNDISEIHYANDVGYNELTGSKVTLFRNQDNSCYIIFRPNDKKYGIFYGINGRSIDRGEHSFSVYELSQDLGSFTDDVPRCICVDITGLYFVPLEENPVNDIIHNFLQEGKFGFRGSVLRVSALDGSITLNDDQPLTEENFFDHWITEDKEEEEEEDEIKIIRSPLNPKPTEIIRNFYPSDGNYRGLFTTYYFDKEYKGYKEDWLNVYGLPTLNMNGGITVFLKKRDWFNRFIKKCIAITKSKSKKGCEELVKDGTFSSILSSFVEVNDYNGNLYNAIVEVPLEVVVYNGSVSSVVLHNSNLFKDLEFVRRLKPSFERVSRQYENLKETDKWLPFEIVKNL
ncbi:hypothetical protein PIROE2DRAFT_14991, partial [Piromyces sp. E2]